MMVNSSCFIGCLMLVASLSPVYGLCSTCLEEQCYDNGECIIGCVAGYVGEYCNEECPPRCLNKVCHLDIIDGSVTCTDGCEPGYCGATCKAHCPGDCVSCDRRCGSCNVTVCPERRYGADCSRVCSERYGKCDKETGQCIICRRGYYGDECNQDCETCFTRAETIYDECLSGCDICKSKGICPAGFHGDACELPCSPGCENRENGCNRATGECSEGCVSGYHGLTCNYKCSERCVSGRCNKATGECSDGCVSGYHGLTCNYSCSAHCLSGRCNKATGECSYGCVSGYHGLTCNYTCNTFCEGGVCNQHDGVCTSGCISGYKSNLDICEKYENEGSHTAVAIAVPITVVCLLAGMVTAAVIWRRRRSRRPNRSQTAHAHEKGTNGTDVDEPLLKYKKGTKLQVNRERIESNCGPSLFIKVSDNTIVSTSNICQNHLYFLNMYSKAIVYLFLYRDLRKHNPEVNYAADQSTWSKRFQYNIYRKRSSCSDLTLFVLKLSSEFNHLFYHYISNVVEKTQHGLYKRSVQKCIFVLENNSDN